LLKRQPLNVRVPNHAGLPVDMTAFANRSVRVISEKSALPNDWERFDLSDCGDTLALNRPLEIGDVGPAWQKAGELPAIGLALRSKPDTGPRGPQKRRKRRKKPPWEHGGTKQAELTDPYLKKWVSGDLDVQEFFAHAYRRWEVGRGPLDMKNVGVEGIIVHSGI